MIETISRKVGQLEQKQEPNLKVLKHLVDLCLILCFNGGLATSLHLLGDFNTSSKVHPGNSAGEDNMSMLFALLFFLRGGTCAPGVRSPYTTTMGQVLISSSR